MYAKIQNGTVVGVVRALPKSHDNVSGFDTLPDSALATYGFVPLTEVYPELAFIEVDDGLVDADGNPVLRRVTTQTYGQPTDEVTNSSVTRTYPVVAKSESDVAAEANSPYLLKLDAIDKKSIRALREGNTQRLADLEAEAAAIRTKLR